VEGGSNNLGPLSGRVNLAGCELQRFWVEGRREKKRKKGGGANLTKTKTDPGSRPTNKGRVKAKGVKAIMAESNQRKKAWREED